MATKIINILKDDRFEEILDIFKKASAEEVIFVLPRRHQALADEADFESLAQAAQEHGRSVLILSSNPEIRNLALQYNLGVLTSEKSGHKLAVEKPKVKPEPESETHPSPSSSAEATDGQGEATEGIAEKESDESKWEDEGGTPTAFEQFEQEIVSGPEVELTAMKRQNRSVSDIVQPPQKEGVKINISKRAEPLLNVEVKKKERQTMDEIESVWQSKPGEKISIPKIVFPKPPLFFNTKFRFLNFKNKVLTFFALGVIFVFAVVIYISIGSAKIIVKPVINELNLNLKIEVSDQFSDIDWKFKRIPGQLFSIEKKLEESFQATGERDVVQKAKGKITVYNEYGTTPQVLIATTRFESLSGLTFRTLKTITVPGMTVKNGEKIPGKIDVEVIADKAGENYNIIPGRFTITAFKEKGDMGKFEKYYGISSEQMKGGIIGKAKVVTSEDYINATKQVSDKLISTTEKELEMQSAGLKTLNSSKPTLKELISSAQPDEATDSFSISQTAESETVGLKESDLNELIVQYVGNTNNLTVLSEKLKLEFKDINFNKETKVLEFTVVIKGPAYSKVDREKIILDLANKNEEEIKDYIKNIEGIASAKVILSPFWVKKVPANKERITLELQYE
ncbi:MAG: hypothetical protein Q8Q89_04670 [bacterium]|nr:hypothetical protein [bacterium]